VVRQEVEIMKDLLKNPRILIWIFCIVISVIIISPNLNPNGVIVTYVQKNASAAVSLNDVIYKVNNEPVTIDISNRIFDGVVKLETNKGIKYVNANNSKLGIDVESVSTTNLKFGLDIKGGVQAVIEPNTTDNATLEQIVSTLQTRINVYGLREAVFRTSYYENKGFVEISIAGGSEAELRELLEKQGMFEGKIPVLVRTVNNVGTLKLDRDYSLIINNGSLEVEGKTLRYGDSFKLAGMNFVYGGVQDNKINITSTVFSGSDVRTVYFDPQRSRIEKQSENNYRWSFGIQLSPESAQRFGWITGNIPIVPGIGSETYLESKIFMYLDNNLIDSLNIVSTLKGRVETEISITGSANSMDQAKSEKTRLQSILRSGALPAAITIVQLDTISPNLGAGFLTNAALAGLGAILGVIIVVSIRYRKPKFVWPMALISISEVLMILGVAVLIGWTIDLPAIAGIIASVGTGIDSQIIILDQTLRGEKLDMSFKEKLKRAFFVVFGSAGTVIAAMLPLMTLGFGMLRGFAITTILGVLIGILIARPAYGVIVEKMQKHHVTK
jgi:preprotein translocase subunit SecD